MKSKKNKYKEGAASFYIVAFSTLILIVLATSFAAVIISEVSRTSNDDLAQSAYDSALAGIEDAKLAYYNYENCKASNSPSSDCQTIINAMSKPNCDMVAEMLGRGDGGQVVESINGNNMEQAYTCVKLYDLVKDYRSTVDSADMIDVVNIKFADVGGSDAPVVERVKKVRISWHSSENDPNFDFLNYNSGKVEFPSATEGNAVPAPISLAMMQTGPTFNIDSFSKVERGKTNRGMVYLVPVKDEKSATDSSSGNYKGAFKQGEGKNHIGADEGFVKSNDRQATNVPFAVKCDSESAKMQSEFACSVEVDIPEPIDGKRNKSNLVFVIGLPYGKPKTDFSLEFFCDSGKKCNDGYYGNIAEGDASESVVNEDESQAYLSGVQVLVDSTGRANDLYRRVEARLDNARKDFALSIMGPLEVLLDNKGTDFSIMDKDFIVTCENDFGASNCG